MHEPADVESLRRRLYRPAASTEDVAAYESARDVPSVARPSAPLARSRRRPLLLTGGAVVLALAGAAALLPRGTVHPALTTAPAARAVAAPQRAARVAITSEADRAGFVRALEDGRDPLVASWLVEHAGSLAGPLGAATRTETDERRGRGPATLVLGAADGTDALTVLIVVQRTAEVRWTLLDRARAVDVRSLVALPGDLAYGTFSGHASRLVLDVPRGVRWDAVTVRSA